MGALLQNIKAPNDVKKLTDAELPALCEELREKIGEKKVLLALSGWVDSSVAAALLAKAVGSQLTCIFVDHGLMRKNEGDEVEAAFADKGVRFIRVNAEERFLGRLAWISDP